ATVRANSGKGAARAVRRAGRVPAVIYGGGAEPEAISLDFNATKKLIFAGHFLTTIFEVSVDGKKTRVIPRDYQLDPVRDQPLHVDFLRITAGQKIRVDVPVHVINQAASPGVKRGGAVNIVLHSVEMMVPPDSIPDGVTVDLTGVEIGKSIHISQIKLPANCTPVDKTDFTLVTIVGKGQKDEEPAAAPAAAAAPAGDAAKKAAEPAKK
ncbi:MAG: 50S ribosomal protein L25/general stress protein Ctc, partial [Alphaproteobacteria bacterium]|nr:50S ribosomal protein L25/general stress protein Ctc [Alphaproteobacteria bacterium]